MDADDAPLPVRLEKEAEFFGSHPHYALASCAFGYIGANRRRLKATHVGDRITLGFDHEVEAAGWIPLEEAPRRLAYPSERKVAESALAALL